MHSEVFAEREILIPAISLVTWQGNSTLGEAQEEARRIIEKLHVEDREVLVKIATSPYLTGAGDRADAVAYVLIALGLMTKRQGEVVS